jgi:hypothetical protein
LAYGTISVDKLPTFIDQSNLSDKSFSFVLRNNPAQSYLTLPGYDSSITNGVDFTFHNVIEQKYYSLQLDSMSRGSTKIPSDGYKAVIDSGTSVIVGNADIVNNLIANITVADDCSNLNTLPDITFTFDGIDYVLAPNDYVLTVEEGGQKECVMGIIAGGFPSTFKYLILGDSFMRRYYSYFDKNNNRVGFIDSQKLSFK